MRTFARLAAVAAFFVLVPQGARAQGSGRSMDIDTSIRAPGMGGVSCGVVWGDPNVWGNVATLAGVSGVRWEHGRTQLVPGLATDVFLRSDRLMVGGGGVGVMSMGNPAGGLRLDYGASEVTDPFGAPIGSFSSYEKVSATALAVSVPALWTAAHPTRPGPSAAGTGWDLALGGAMKHTDVQLAPSALGGTSSATTYDWGAQLRISPLDLFANDPRLEAFKSAGVRCDLGLGYSILNAAGGEFHFGDMGGSSPATCGRRQGIGVRLGIDPPWPSSSGRAPGWLAAYGPLVSVAWAADHEANGAAGQSDVYHVDKTGYEVSFANVLTWRHGHTSDYAGDVDGATSGWGIGLPIGPWVGFRYDRATFPQARNSGLPDVTRNGWTAWIDAVRIVRDLERGSEAHGAAR